MYKVNCGVSFNKGIQMEFDDISDFYAFENARKDDKHPIRGYVKSIDTEVVYFDEYDNGTYEWFALGGKFLNNLEPLRWHPLEDYIEENNNEINQETVEEIEK